jgi:hypothetical protein
MDEELHLAIITAYKQLPDSCRYNPASEVRLQDFEQEFGAIPGDYRWFLANCGGGVCGSEWIDGIEQLFMTHRKYRAESNPGGWTMRDVFIIGWDGAGNPYGIHQDSGRLLVEDHDFGGTHEWAESLAAYLCNGLGVQPR